MTRPHPRATIRGPNVRAQRNGPFRLMSMTASQSASAICCRRSAHVDAGVVDQDVDRAEHRFDFLCEALDVGELTSRRAQSRVPAARSPTRFLRSGRLARPPSESRSASRHRPPRPPPAPSAIA